VKTKISLGARELVELGRMRCGPGRILRRGYTRKDGTYVKPGCVEDQGERGKTPAAKRILPQPKEGSLKGWRADASSSSRHAALRKAVKAEGCRNTISRLSLERGFTKKTSPKTAATAAGDQNWLRKQGFCRLKGKRK
jgi:uncharacterized protein DUF5771